MKKAILISFFLGVSFFAFGQDEIILKSTGKPFDYGIKILKVTDDSIYYKAFWKTYVLPLSDVASYHISPPKKTDTLFVCDNRWHINFGYSASILSSKQVITSYSDFGKSVSRFTTYFKGITPDFAIVAMLHKNKYYIKNEFAYTMVHTGQSYVVWITHWNPNGADSVYIREDYHYNILNYRIQAGVKYRRFIILPGLQVGYIFDSYRVNFREYQGLNYWIKGWFPCAANFEIGIKLSENFYFSTKFSSLLFSKYYLRNTIGNSNMYSIYFSIQFVFRNRIKK